MPVTLTTDAIVELLTEDEPPEWVRHAILSQVVDRALEDTD